MLADEYGNSLGAADRVFKRRYPSDSWTKLAAVKEGAKSLVAEPAVQLRGGSLASSLRA
jgi:hypothetical protein